MKISFDKSKAEIFDEFSFKNWQKKSYKSKEVSVHLTLARISWACLYATCYEHKLEFKSKYRWNNNIPSDVNPKLKKNVGYECAYALEIIFGQDQEIAKDISKSFSNLMQRIEKNNNSE